MMKTIPFVLSSSPRESRSGSDAAAKASTSSESELDSLSIESSAEEVQPTDPMKTKSNCRYPMLGSAAEVDGMSSSPSEQKKHKKGFRKVIGAITDIKFGKQKKKVTERDSPMEEPKPVTGTV